MCECFRYTLCHMLTPGTDRYISNASYLSYLHYLPKTSSCDVWAMLLNTPDGAPSHSLVHILREPEQLLRSSNISGGPPTLLFILP